MGAESIFVVYNRASGNIGSVWLLLCQASFLSWPDLFGNQVARASNGDELKLTTLSLMTAKKPYSVVLNQQAVTETPRELFKLSGLANPL